MAVNNIGEKVKQVREIKNISIDDLAIRSKMSVAQIKKIEEQASIPSLSPLIKIGRALGVRIGTFLDDAENLGPVVTKRNQHQSGSSFSSLSSDSRSNLDFYMLAGNKSGRHMEPFIIDVNATKDPTLSTHEGEEFIFVLEGSVKIIYGKETYLLEQGDSIYYDSIIEHDVIGLDNSTSKILAVVYAPL